MPCKMPSKKKTTKKTVKRPSAAKKSVAKKPVKKATKKPAKKSARKPNASFMKPVTPDAALAAVIGPKAIPRTEVTKKIWDYIRKNKLQDQNNRRMINADDKLLAVFGGKKQVSMFDMTKLVSNRLS